MSPIATPIDLKEDEELIKLLEDVGNLKSEYPPELLAARRAAFIAQVDQWEKGRSADQPSSKNGFAQHQDK